MTLNARCSICFDDFSDEITPYATTCGHLYCIDCATFMLAKDNPSCAFRCQEQNQTLDSLIKLFPDTTTLKGDARPDILDDREAVVNGEEVVEICARLNEQFSTPQVQVEQVKGVERVGDIVTRGLSFNASVAKLDNRPDLRNLSKTFGLILVDIRNKLASLQTLLSQPRPQPQQTHHERSSSSQDKLEIARLRARITEMETSYLNELETQRIQFRIERGALQDRIEGLRREYTRAANELVKIRDERDSKKEELHKCRESVLKYQKKYHVLKNSIKQMKSRASRDEDDSLIVLPS